MYTSDPRWDKGVRYASETSKSTESTTHRCTYRETGRKALPQGRSCGGCPCLTEFSYDPHHPFLPGQHFVIDPAFHLWVVWRSKPGVTLCAVAWLCHAGGESRLALLAARTSCFQLPPVPWTNGHHLEHPGEWLVDEQSILSAFMITFGAPDWSRPQETTGWDAPSP